MASSASERPGPGQQRPLVGVTSYLETSRTGVWDRRAAVLPEVYLHAVSEAGGTVLVLPPQPAGGADVSAVLDALDALVVIGGADVDPARYGAAPHPATAAPRTDRDAWEVALVLAAVERDLPLLGVCRGAQLLDVALGGTLHQHLPDVVGHTGHQPAPAVFGTTPVRLEPDSVVGHLLPSATGTVEVHCHHHQAVDVLGRGLVVSARALDGTIEAVEVPGAAFCVGVQWHTEEDRHDRRLFAALVAAGRQHREHQGRQHRA